MFPANTIGEIDSKLCGESMNKRRSYLFKNTISFTISTVGTSLISFLLIPFYSRFLSTSEYGIVDLFTTIGMLVVPIVTLNIGQAIMRFSLDEDSDNNRIDSIAVLMTLFSLVFGLVAFLVVKLFVQAPFNGLLFYLYVISNGLFQIFSFSIRGRELVKEFAFINIARSVLITIFGVLFLAIIPLGINGYFESYIVSNFIASIYCLYKIGVFSLIKHFIVDSVLLKQMLSYSIFLVPESLMWWIINSSDRIMVTAMVGVAANGIYAISYKLPSILSVLSSSFTQAWSFSAIKENESEDIVSFSNNMYRRFLGLQMIATIALMCIMKPFMRIYVAPEFYDAWKYTPYLLIGYFFLSLSNFLATLYTVHKDSKGFLFSGGIGAVLNIALNLLLIPQIGVHGAAFATGFCYFAVFLYRVWDTKKYLSIQVFKPRFVVGYLCLLLGGLTMAIPYTWGYAVLFVELVIVCLLNVEFIKESLEIIKNLLNRVHS